MKNGSDLFTQLALLKTEERNKASYSIDTASVTEILSIINSEDSKIPGAVNREIPFIARAVNLAVKAFTSGGRLLYFGAGTSGRLGILDAAECPPTFGTEPSMVVGTMAGGRKAVFRSQEGAEDREQDGARDIRAIKTSRNDVVCGIAASIRTPYVLGALREAKRRGAKTILVTTNPRSQLAAKFPKIGRMVDVAICPVVGPEVIMGSTRMKSGTAQKLVLNMITTASMIRLGKVYENMMVDLKLNSRKLEERAKRVLMILTGVDRAAAARYLRSAGGHVKTALVMIRMNVSSREAKARLERSGGIVRRAIRGS